MSNNTFFSERVISIINNIRNNPSEYSEELKSYKKYFNRNILYYPNHPFPIATTEGYSAVTNAIEDLSSMTNSNTNTLSLSNELSLACNDLLNNNTNNETIDIIISKYCKVFGKIEEITEYGSYLPEVLIYSLIVDDGDLSRKNRRILLNPLFKYIGLSTSLVTKENNDNFRITKIILTKNVYNKEILNDFNRNSKIYSELLTYIDSNSNSSYKDNNKNYNKADQEEQEQEEYETYTKEVNYDINQTVFIQEDKDNEIPKGLIKIDKIEKDIIENGVNKKLIRCIKYYIDGKKETDIYKKIV